MTDTNFDYQQMDLEERPFARRLAMYIANRLPTPVIDLGAGTGVYVEELRKMGVRASGIDIADPQPRPDLVETRSMLDFMRPQPLVLCLEVAEHIASEYNREIISSVWNNTFPGGLVIWSAAQPGQGGVGHINCQTPEYWHQLAVDRGFHRRQDIEQHMDQWILAGYHMGWFARNRQIWWRPQ